MPTWDKLQKGKHYTRKNTGEDVGDFVSSTRVGHNLVSVIFQKNGKIAEHVYPSQTVPKFRSMKPVSLKKLIPNHIYSSPNGVVYGTFLRSNPSLGSATFRKNGRNITHMDMEHSLFVDTKRTTRTHKSPNVNALTCSICTELFTEPCTLDCNHSFCKRCIEMWNREKHTCPLCRAPITHIRPNPELKRTVESYSKR